MSAYDVVVDTLQAKYDALMKITMQNMRSEYIGMNVMDDIRLQQCDQLKTAIRMWLDYKQALVDEEDE